MKQKSTSLERTAYHESGHAFPGYKRPQRICAAICRAELKAERLGV